MIKDITLGQYFPGSSVLHRLDPRMKIVLLIIYITALFLTHSALSYFFMALVTLSLILLSRVPFKLYIKGLKPLFVIILFTAVLNIFIQCIFIFQTNKCSVFLQLQPINYVSVLYIINT